MRALPAHRTPDRDAGHGPGEAPRAPEPAAAAVLTLQRSAGNHAVANLLARDALDLLVPETSSSSRGGRRRLVETLSGAETATAWIGLRDGGALELSDSSVKLEEGERAELLPILQARKESFFRDFAAGRRPLLETMQAAAQPSQRHAAITALSAYDEPRLPELVTMRNNLKGRWLVDDLEARDAVLAALQLQAATDAQGELETDWKTVRDRVTKATGMGPDSQWCGMFSGDHLIRASLDEDLRKGFMHTANVEAFFTYNWGQNADRIPRWIWDDQNGWKDVKAHHTAQGAMRKWLGHAATSKGGALDIQPGDMVLIDRGPTPDGTADHIVLASSYDPQTGTLVTIGGNDSGYVIRGPDDKEPGKDDKRTTGEEATGLDLKKPVGDDGKVAVGVHQVAPEGKLKRAVVYGVGRPSLIDLEERTYAFKPWDKPPPPPKHAK